MPSKSSGPHAEQSNSLLSRSVPDYVGQRMLQKILLVGYSGSGTSTIFKQVSFPVQARKVYDFGTRKVVVDDIALALEDSNRELCNCIHMESKAVPESMLVKY